MLSVKGTFLDGVARPAEPLEGLDGRAVIITFLEEGAATSPPPVEQPDPDRRQDEPYDPATDPLMQLIERCKIDTGIGDLAHQHDHYLHGRPKRP